MPGEEAESEDREHDSPLFPPDSEDDGHGGDTGAGWSGLPQAGSSSRPRSGSASRSQSPPGAPGGGHTDAADLPVLDPGDPLHMVNQVTPATAASSPFSTRPGDWVYESDDVSFNLSAAQKCLDETRRTVALLREGNRHRRSEEPGPSTGEPASGSHRTSSPTVSPTRSSPSPGTASRSRSRRRRGSSPADRRDSCQTKPGCPLKLLLSADTGSHEFCRCPASHKCQGESAPSPPVELPLKGRREMCKCSKHPPQWWSPKLTPPGYSAARLPASVGTETLPCLRVEKISLSLLLALFQTLCWCVGCVALTLELSLSSLGCTPQHPGPAHRYYRPAYLASWVPVAREAWSECLWLHMIVPSCLQVLDVILGVACSNVEFCSSSLRPGPVQVSACPLTATQSRPGPKSRGLSNRCMHYLILLLCLQPACAGSQAEARVAAHATRAAGGICSFASCLPASMPKPGGFPTSVKTRQPLNVPNKRSAKRAFQRACNRATRYGHTQYRGRTFTSAQVPLDRRQAKPTPCFSKTRKHTSPEGITVLSWNAGGLGGGVYDEIMTHLSASNVDIAVIQESKWSECMEYTSGAWSCIHSGCKTHKHAGILVAVHSRVALPSQLRFEHYLKGRLLHVRVPLQTSDRRHLHVIAIYQKTHVASDKHTPVQRQQAWQALHKCLSRVPARDSIVLTGDFNTPLACLPPFVGPFVGAPLSHPPDDVSTLEVLMQTFRLTALNTWYPNPGGVHTFSFGKAHSQIDYIMVRLSEASSSARQVRTMHQFQVGAARKGGAYHSPLQTTLAVSRPYWVHTGHRQQPCIDQEALLQALDHPNKADNLQKIACIRQVVATHVAHHSDLQGVQSLHKVLHDACCTVFPAHKALPTSAPPWQQPQVQDGIRNLWSKWRAFKQVRKHGLRGWFQAWRAWKDFDWRYRVHQKRCKQARRTVLLDAMHEAEQHAKTHNTRGIYQILKRLAPKQARRRMQLRGEEGQMLEPSAELDLLEQHFSKRFTATQQVDVELASHSWEGTGALTLDVATVCRYIQQVPRRKAVPQGHPPSASWRLCADLISPWLCNVVLEAWSTPRLEVPRAWTDVDLALVPKPDKPGREPKDYRPIGLACPLGKKFLGALLQPHVPGIIEQIKTFPQFAYQQGRSQFSALRRVYQHCAAVRTQLQHHTRNLHQRFAGAKPVPLYGALMITVDLAQAFDRMPRTKLYQGLCRLGLPQDLTHVLMAWHSTIHYSIHHHQETRTFHASQGIRQGCSVAPLLWLIFSHEVSCALADKLGAATVHRVLTIFADDYHLADSFTSVAELEALLDVITVLFRTLEAFGMEVSDQKSKAIMVLRGTLSNTVRRRFVRSSPQGDGSVLRIHTRGGALNIPLTDCFTYLGARVSYANFEKQTLEWRLNKGEAAFQRLGTVLKGQHHLTAPQRLRLWQACVWTTTQYGLTASGLTPTGAQTLETSVVRQLRAILRLPAHLTHTTNAQVCAAAGIPLPTQMLRQLLQAEGDRLSHAPPDHLVCSPAQDWWQHLVTTFAPQVTNSIIVLDQGQCDAQPCPHCGVTYHTRAALKTHIAKQHKDAAEVGTEPPRLSFSKQLDSSGGLPQCRRCAKQFPTWQLLERHITGGHCSAKPSEEQEQTAFSPPDQGPCVVADTKLAHHPDILCALRQHRVNIVLRLTDRHKYLQRCLICGQWLASPAVVKTHYKGSHPHIFAHTAKATKLCSTFSSAGSPCLYCGVKTKQPRHHKLQCSVLWQFSLLATYLPATPGALPEHDGGDESRAGASGALRATGDKPSCSLRDRPAGLRQLSLGQSLQQGSPAGQRQEGQNSWRQSALPSLWAGGPSPKRRAEGGQAAGLDQMARLVLRQETNLQVLKQNSAWDVYLQPGQQGPLPMLFRASEAYRSEAKSRRMDCPLRAQLLHTLFKTVLTCIQNIKDNAAQTQAAQQRGWLTPVGSASSGLDRGQRPPSSRKPGIAYPAPGHGPGCTTQGCGSSLQCHTSAGSGPQRHDSLHAGDWAPGRWRDGCLERSGSPSRACGPANCGHAIEERWAATIQFGGGPSEDAERALGLILNNPTQHCYINSFVLAWLWTFGLFEAPEAQFFGAHVQAWRDVLYSHAPITIYRLPSWTRLFRGWDAPASQHDAADFISHVMSRMQPLALLGEWQSRLGLGGELANVIDSGSLLSPIVLHLLGDGQEDDLQSCIHRWHQQAYTHGLREAYPVLMVQLARYNYGDNGVSKDRTGVAVPRKLLLPVFGRGLKTFQATYTVCSIIIHHGNHPRAGHYTSLLLEPGALPRSRLWGTDDGKVAKPYGRFPKCVERDAYIFILARCRFPATGVTGS